VTSKTITLCDSIIGTEFLYRHIDRKVYVVNINTQKTGIISDGSQISVCGMGMPTEQPGEFGKLIFHIKV
jgi:DnaJ-class molecular chaperone